MNTKTNHSHKQHIRKYMQARETEELIDIWVQYDKSQWVETAFDIIYEILLERGFTEEQLEQLSKLPALAKEKTVPRPAELENWDTTDLVALWIEYDLDQRSEDEFDRIHTILSGRGFTEKELDDIAHLENILLSGKVLPEKERLKTIFQSIDWTEDSLDVVYRWLARHGQDLSEIEAELSDLEPPPGEGFLCVQCSNTVPLTAEVCPSCGLALYPEDSAETPSQPEEEGLAKEAIFENYIQESILDFDELETAELLEIWEENDFTNWATYEFEAIHRLLLARGETPPYRFDPVDETLAHLPYLDEETLLLRGIPGNRVRPGRLGLDPIDHPAEEGRWYGLL